MQKNKSDNYIWPLLIELFFLVLLAFEIVWAIVISEFGNSAFLWILQPVKMIVEEAWFFGILPAGVIGLVFAKKTGKFRILTIIASIINLIAGILMLGLFVLVIVEAFKGNIQV